MIDSVKEARAALRRVLGHQAFVVGLQHDTDRDGARTVRAVWLKHARSSRAADKHGELERLADVPESQTWSDLIVATRNAWERRNAAAL